MADIERVTIKGVTYDIKPSGGGVTSVNTKTGDVVLDADDVGALPDDTSIPSNTSDLNNDSGFITSSDIPVTSVNSKTGAVSLSASDVGALPSSTTIPQGTVTSVRVQATSPVNSSSSSAQSTTLNTTISLADGYGDTKNPYASKTKNYVLASPNGSNGTPSFRALVKADLPTLTASDVGAIATETDPTVPSWAKASSKPSYTASEVGAMASTQTFSFTGTSGSVSVTGTTTGSVSAPTISVSSAGSTGSAVSGLETAEPDDTAPSNPITYCEYDSQNEELILYQMGYTTSSFKTGDASYTASAPSFTGGSMTSTGSFTPSGSVTKD